MRIKKKLKQIAASTGVTGSGGAATVLGTKAAISLLGFKATGIAAGSAAASMMSSTAIASGGAVQAGSLVAFCQSAGVIGLGAATLPIALVGGGVWYVSYHYLIRPRL